MKYNFTDLNEKGHINSHTSKYQQRYMYCVYVSTPYKRVSVAYL